MRFKVSACATVIAFGLIGSAAYAQDLTPGTRVQTTPGITRTVLHKTDFPGNQYATVLFLAEIAPGAATRRRSSSSRSSMRRTNLSRLPLRSERPVWG